MKYSKDMPIVNQFRQKSPERSQNVQVKTDYKQYKNQLISDFNAKCGYTDCHHDWFGGKRNFHIDHFIAKSKRPDLLCVYTNLVYATSYVNIAKSDDEDDRYLDPCDVDYNQHFGRDEFGNIIPITDEAIFMHRKLKLYLKRYGIIWKLQQIYEEWKDVEQLIENMEENEDKAMLLSLSGSLARQILIHREYLLSEF